MFANQRIYRDMDLQTTDEILIDLRQACNEAGSQAAWADANDVSPAYLSDVLNKRRDISESFAKALGYERVVLYRKVQKVRKK